MSNINDVWVAWDSYHPSQRITHVTTLEQRSSRFTIALPALEGASLTPPLLSLSLLPRTRGAAYCGAYADQQREHTCGQRNVLDATRSGDTLRDVTRRVWQSPPVARKRPNDAAAPHAVKSRSARKECDGAALPKYVPSNLRKLLRKECVNRRGYREWSDVARMCADNALFQEVASSEWNARAHNACSCAINAYRDKVLHLTRFRRKPGRSTLRGPRESERVRALANALNNPTLLNALQTIRNTLGDVSGRST